MKTRVLPILTALSAAALVAVAPAAAAARETVTVADFSYSPAVLTVKPGTEVTWTNKGPSTHTATAGDGSFDTGLLKPGDSHSETFNQVGTFQYACTLHPDMTGSIVVQSAGSSVEDSDTSTTPKDQPSGGTAQQDDDGKAEERVDHPRTGNDAGLQLLLGVGLLFFGANGRRFATRGVR